MSDLATPALLVIFVAAALVTWVAGVNLARATDLLDDRYGLGEALGGMILLSTAAGSLIPALEGILVIAVVCVTVMSAVLPSTASIGPLGVGATGIVVIWLLGIMTLNRTRARADLVLVGAGGDGPPPSDRTAAEPRPPPPTPRAPVEVAGRSSPSRWRRSSPWWPGCCWSVAATSWPTTGA